MTDEVDQVFEVPPRASWDGIGWDQGGIMPHFSLDGVPVSRTGNFFSDTVQHQGWNPLEGGALDPAWEDSPISILQRAKRHEMLTRLATALKKASTE